MLTIDSDELKLVGYPQQPMKDGNENLYFFGAGNIQKRKQTPRLFGSVGLVSKQYITCRRRGSGKKY